MKRYIKSNNNVFSIDSFDKKRLDQYGTTYWEKKVGSNYLVINGDYTQGWILNPMPYSEVWRIAEESEYPSVEAEDMAIDYSSYDDSRYWTSPQDAIDDFCKKYHRASWLNS